MRRHRILTRVCTYLLVQSFLFVTIWTIAHQAPLSMEFSKQEYWSGLSFPPLGDLSDPGTEATSPTSPALQDSLSTEPSGELMT